MTKYKKNGKKLGVLGGMGPAAAAEFLRQLAARCPAASDQEHPVVYMIGDCELPDRSTAIFGEGESPAALLEAHLNKLCELGADVLAVPCNTAHYFIDDFRERLPQPLVHIIEETVLAAQRLNPGGAWMLSTHGTRASGLYQKYADKYGYTLFLPSDEQAEKAQHFICKVGRLGQCRSVDARVGRGAVARARHSGDDGLHRAAFRLCGVGLATG